LVFFLFPIRFPAGCTGSGKRGASPPAGTISHSRFQPRLKRLRGIEPVLGPVLGPVLWPVFGPALGTVLYPVPLLGIAGAYNHRIVIVFGDRNPAPNNSQSGSDIIGFRRSDESVGVILLGVCSLRR